MFSGWDRPSHWLVLAVVVVVLFGYKKLPEMSRSVGRSLRIFKTEMKGMDQDEASRDAAAPAEPPAVQPVVPPNPVLPAAASPSDSDVPAAPPATPLAAQPETRSDLP